MKYATSVDSDRFGVNGALQGTGGGNGNMVSHHPGGNLTRNPHPLGTEGTDKLYVRPFFDYHLMGLNSSQESALVANGGFSGANQIAADFPADNRLTTERFDTGEVSLGGDVNRSLGINTAAKHRLDLEILQVDVCAAMRADARLGFAA